MAPAEKRREMTIPPICQSRIKQLAKTGKGTGHVSNNSILKIEKVSKSFSLHQTDVPVLSQVSIEVRAGESVAITGPSGSGKSTLLHLMGTLEHANHGSISINGIDPANLSNLELARLRNRQIGFIFQDHQLLPQYSVLENVLLPVLAFEKISKSDTEKACELIERAGLSHRMRHRPGELSGGEKQRVAVARALINSPGLLLCDEPTGNLDSKSASAVADILFELHRERQSALIVVTHNERLAQRFQRRYQLVDGGLVQSD